MSIEVDNYIEFGLNTVSTGVFELAREKFPVVTINNKSTAKGRENDSPSAIKPLAHDYSVSHERVSARLNHVTGYSRRVACPLIGLILKKFQT